MVAANWPAPVSNGKEPDKTSRAIGAGIGGAIGGVLGVLIAGPIGGIIGAGFASWIGHAAAEEASKQGL